MFKNFTFPLLPNALLVLIMVLSGPVYTQEPEYRRPEMSAQIKIVLKSEVPDFPQVDLLQNVSLSDESGIIEKSIVYQVEDEEGWSSGCYFWDGSTWQELIDSKSDYDIVVIWNIRDREVSYVDIDGSVLKFGIGGMDQAEFKELQADEKTLVYSAPNGQAVLVSMDDLLGVEERIKTIAIDNDRLIFYKNDVLQKVYFNRPPKVMERRVISSDFELITPEIEEIDMMKVIGRNVENPELEEEDLKETPVSEVLPKSKTREGREIKTIEDNEDGTFTITYADGSRFTSLDLKNPKVDNERELLKVVNNGDGTFTAKFTDGTSLSSNELSDFYNFEGYAEGEEPEVDLVVDNGDGTYNIILSNGVELSSIDFASLTNPHKEKNEDGRGILSVLNNSDGTYNVIFTDGTEINSKDLSDLKEYIPVSSGKENEQKEEGRKKSDEDSGSSERGIENIREEEDGAFTIALTDGTVFSTSPLPKDEDGNSFKAGIEGIVDNTDGTFTVLLTGGIQLFSLEVLNSPVEEEVGQTENKKGYDSIAEDKINQDIPIEPGEESKEEIEEDKEMVIPVKGPAKEKRQEVNAEESEIGSQAEIIVRKQREEIMELKKREAEKSREIQEMKSRLERLEQLLPVDPD